MASGADPHGVLGVARNATLDEIKRAYRALAKQHHPDAGRGSVPRFLEIQAAYEALVGGAGRGRAGPAGDSARSSRRPAQPGGRSTGAGWGSPPRPGTEWARRPRDRAEAAGRPEDPAGGTTAGGTTAGPNRARGSGPAGARGPAGPTGGPAGGSTGAGTAGTAGDGHRERRSRRERWSRKATLGSTTYDEAGEALTPPWDGASWYGPSSGTYWTINPREYADPRKHGPEYQERAGRAAREAGRGPRTAGGPRPARPDRTASAAARETGAPPEARPPRETGARTAAEPVQGPGPQPGATGRAASAPPPSRSVSAPAGRMGPSPGEVPGPAPVRPGPAERSGPGGADPSPVVRGLLAAAGWAPLGLALAAAVGLPGGLIATLPVQVAGAVLMTRLPRFAWSSAGGLVAVVVGAVPGVAVLAALGEPIRPGGPAPLSMVVLAIAAWAVGAVLAAGGRIVAPPWRKRA